MQSTDITVLKQVQQWLEQGKQVWLATVLQTYGSSPRQPGALCAISQDGLLVGSVSGGCIEEDLKEKAMSLSLAQGSPETVVYGESVEERDRYRLPCGGTLRLLIENLHQTTWTPQVIKAVEQRQSIKRVLSLDSKCCVFEQVTTRAPIVEVKEKTISFVYGPRAKMLLIGVSETAKYLASMASSLDYHVYVAEPRDELQYGWKAEDGELLKMMPDDAVTHINPDSNTCIITLTHDPKLDDMALLEALKSDAFYIGALGSKRTNDKRRERLALFDLSESEISRLHGPVGLNIGSKTPAEIAIAIIAELVQIKRQQSSQNLDKNQIRCVSHG